MICSGCLKESMADFCQSCRKELFDRKSVSCDLSFDSPYNDHTDIFSENTKKISISGVQVKYSLKLDGDTLQLTDRGGEFILKPIPVGTFQNLNQAPANEHLTMQIARQVYKLSIPPNALIRFRDGSQAYIVRRFDRRVGGEKLQQEDFAQLAQMSSESHGQNYKYDLSYEEIAGLIRQYIPTYLIELEKFFKVILFNYLFGNGDAHLKNFSVIRTEHGDYTLTPMYDLLCTKLHSPNESDLALDLFKEGFPPTFEAVGFYTHPDFLEFGQAIGIRKSRVERILKSFTEPVSLALQLIDASLLDSEIKSIYKSIYLDRLSRMKL